MILEGDNSYWVLRSLCSLAGVTTLLCKQSVSVYTEKFEQDVENKKAYKSKAAYQRGHCAIEKRRKEVWNSMLSKQSDILEKQSVSALSYFGDLLIFCFCSLSLCVSPLMKEIWIETPPPPTSFSVWLCHAVPTFTLLYLSCQIWIVRNDSLCLQLVRSWVHDSNFVRGVDSKVFNFVVGFSVRPVISINLT